MPHIDLTLRCPECGKRADMCFEHGDDWKKRKGQRMTTEHLTHIAELVNDVVAADGGELLEVGIAEMGDGSGRTFARFSTYDRVNELEQEYRICSPAPHGGPSWTWTMTDWTVEVRVGESWMMLEQVEAG